MLTDGSAISSDEYDDVNPVLIRLPDESLVLVFESNRPCAEGCDGSYNLFVAVSEEPYYGYYIPAFYEPVVVNSSASAHNISASRFNFQATYSQGSITMLLQDGSQIKYLSLPEPAITIGDTTTPPMPIPNANRYNDTLVHLDSRTFQMISRDSAGDLYFSRIGDPLDSGTQIFNDELESTNNAARIVPAISGFTDAIIYEYDGYLAFGWHDYIGDYMDSFNDALDRENLELSYVSVLHMYLSETELLLFSAGEPGQQHDLYAVDSHTLDELWFQDAALGYEYFYSDNFSIYVSSPLSSGNLASLGGGANGIEGADNICNVDTGQPDINVYYKAMLVDNAANRVATITGPADGDGQEDWVLFPFVSYFPGGGGPLIGTADSVGLLTSMSGAVTPLPINAYTGFASATDWSADATNHCGDWASTGGNGAAGISDNPSTILGGTTQPCNAPAGTGLYCVEQP